MIASVASKVTDVVGELQSLADLPKDVWELVTEPPAGFQFRKHAYTPGVTWDTVLDGGAAFSLIAEDYLVRAINCAVANGSTPESQDWPLAGLQWWGSDSRASAVAKKSGQEPEALSVMGIVLFRVTLKTIDGREVIQIFKLRILRAGCSSWTSLLLGAPDLDQSPPGLGHRATLACHVLTSLSMVLRD